MVRLPTPQCMSSGSGEGEIMRIASKPKEFPEGGGALWTLARGRLQVGGGGGWLDG